MSELKQCPLCNARAKGEDHKTDYEIFCPKCGLSLTRATKEETETVWNNRRKE